jgi:hypothetical protein
MIALLCFLGTLLASPFRSKSLLEAENAALRQQLIVLQRRGHGRAYFTNSDRLFFVQLYASISCECEVAHTSLAISPSKVPDSEVGSGARRQTWHRNQIALHLGSRWSLR